ncbi:hypothetical protein SK355_13575 [Candidatus Fukatsuia symbiotica]|uniref:Uncharacterized protein n=1 Tax=Candidatus Fukatsuia symbiotica TaxID=1878942 RepID=A0A2U8I4V2_9GAMM|nr:hypothetical protein [Candidatus Fukatsuia symbiotica]AWK14149.1 hypothetical protein CCS41_06105 [Candidatus Fukatsuia symbiotica]MEA9446177.1 hypothetical protein [Candidatus Fukatsuia symbiotica]
MYPSSVSNRGVILNGPDPGPVPPRKKIKFLRHKSINDCITNIKDGYYPSLERNYILGESVTSALIQANAFWNKANRRDVPTSNSPNGVETIRTVRERIRRKADGMSDDLQQEFDDACKNNDRVTIQRVYSELVVRVYENHQADQNNPSSGNLAYISKGVETSARTNESEYKEGPPTYCGEISYLVYALLCREGVNPEEMRVICFTENNPDDPDLANNHALIIYSSDRKLFESMERYCGVSEGNPNSYSHFIDFCAQINEEKEIFLIIDPWSKDNKIIDPLIKDEVFYSIKNKFINENDQAIKTKFLKHIIGSTLAESEVLAKSYGEPDFSLCPEPSVHIDVPILAPNSDSSSSESDSSMEGIDA